MRSITLLTIFCVFTRESSGVGILEKLRASFRQRRSPSRTVSYEMICASDCLCGLLRHPLQNVMTGESTFMRFQNRSLIATNRDDPFEKWLPRVTIDISLSYPSRIVFCIHNSLEHLPQVNASLDSFLSELNVIVFSQGNLQQILSNDLEPFALSLEYLDLSHNRITYISHSVFQEHKKLQAVDLRFNSLNMLGDPTNGMVSSGFLRPVLRLRGNPLHCSCGLAQTLHLHFDLSREDNACCTINTYNNNTNERCDYNVARQSSVAELLRQTCPKNQSTDPVIQANYERAPGSANLDFHDVHRGSLKKKYGSMSPEEKHHIVDEQLNISFSHGGDQESGAGESLHAHRLTRSEHYVDFPLLITMAAWFVMVYLGITKFIRVNAMDHENHAKYLTKLTPQKQAAASS